MELQASVIIPTFNQSRRLRRCINGVLNQSISRKNYEVIVVNDGSVDDTDIVLNKFKSEHGIIYVKNKVNSGLSTTRNKGINIAKSDILIFIDSDIIVDFYFIEKNLKYHEKFNQDSLAIIGNLSTAPEYIDGSNFSKYVESRNLGSRSKRDKKHLNYLNLPCRYFSGGLCSVKKISMLDAGAYNIKYRFWGSEDVDMGYRLKKIGVKFVFRHDVKGIHHDDVRLQRFKEKKIENAREGIPFLIANHPDYLKDTPRGYLHPFDILNENLIVTIKKVVLRIILNPFFIYIIESLMVLTDKIPIFYFHTFYKYLEAGWYLKGINEKNFGFRKVEYIPEDSI